MRHFRAALAGLPLDGEVTAHVETLLHISTAYRSWPPPQQKAEPCSCKYAMRAAYKEQNAPLGTTHPSWHAKQLAGS